MLITHYDPTPPHHPTDAAELERDPAGQIVLTSPARGRIVVLAGAPHPPDTTYISLCLATAEVVLIARTAWQQFTGTVARCCPHCRGERLDDLGHATVQAGGYDGTCDGAAIDTFGSAYRCRACPAQFVLFASDDCRAEPAEDALTPTLPEDALTPVPENTRPDRAAPLAG